jgi:DNA polymerase-3 subunit epsilon
VWLRLEPLLEGADFIAAHNAPFDRGVLNACCARYGLAAPQIPFRCTVQLARQAWNIRPTKLSDVCRELAIPLNHHEALSDALACAKIVLAAGKA